MAAITVGTLVVKSTTATVTVVRWGATVTAGQPLYLDSGTLKYSPSANTSATVAAATCIALTGGAADEYGTVISAGSLDLGATLVVGTIYCVGDSAGNIVPATDNATGDFVTILGVATAANSLKLMFQSSGVAIP